MQYLKLFYFFVSIYRHGFFWRYHFTNVDFCRLFLGLFSKNVIFLAISSGYFPQTWILNIVFFSETSTNGNVFFFFNFFQGLEIKENETKKELSENTPFFKNFVFHVGTDHLFIVTFQGPHRHEFF